MSTVYNRYLDAALTTPILGYSGVYQEQSPKKLQSASAMMLLALDEAQNGVTEARHERLMLHYRNVIKSGKEPCVDCSHYWSYVPLTCAIALAKKTDSIWSEFTAEEVAKFDFLMTCFAVISNFIANDSNDYRTGLARRGDVAKHWNPNYKLSLVGPMVACGVYFGSDDIIDSLLMNFDYDSTIAKMKEYGFINMLKVWEGADYDNNGSIVPGVKKMLEEAGRAFVLQESMGLMNVYTGGQGLGAKIPFLYKGYRATDIEIVNFLLNDCYNGGAIFSAIDDDGDGINDAGIVDGSVSPYEGQEGLMTEFNGTDYFGIRSDAYYCEIDFIMVASLLGMLKQVGLYNEFAEFSLYSKVYVGNADLFYKLSKGYLSFAQGKQHTMVANNLLGYFYIKAYWDEYFKSPSELVGE